MTVAMVTMDLKYSQGNCCFLLVKNSLVKNRDKQDGDLISVETLLLLPSQSNGFRRWRWNVSSPSVVTRREFALYFYIYAHLLYHHMGGSVNSATIIQKSKKNEEEKNFLSFKRKLQMQKKNTLFLSLPIAINPSCSNNTPLYVLHRTADKITNSNYYNYITYRKWAVTLTPLRGVKLRDILTSSGPSRSCSSVNLNVNFWYSFINATMASCHAYFCPMQPRGPSPKGMYASMLLPSAAGWWDKKRSVRKNLAL